MKAQVRPHNGTPTLFLNDEAVFADCQWVGSLDTELVTPVTIDAIRAYRDANVHIYSTDAFSYEWTGPDPDGARKFDFAPVAERLQTALNEDPEGLFILRIMFETRYCIDNWFNARYPQELEGLTDGLQISASFASTVWQDDVKQVLIAFIAYLREAGLYDHVIAYQICTGVCGEWIKSWSSMGLANGDFERADAARLSPSGCARSTAATAALQAAWADPQVTLDTAECAHAATSRISPPTFSFATRASSARPLTSTTCYAETAADALLVVLPGRQRADRRREAHRRVLWLPDGPGLEQHLLHRRPRASVESSQVSTIQRSGHLGLAQALRSPDIDFLVSPYSYRLPRAWAATACPCSRPKSLRVHGKLYLFEEDTLMHNNFDPGKRMHPVARSIAIYQRNFAQVLTHGLGITWLENDHFPEDPASCAEAHRWQTRYDAIGNWALELNRAPSAEVAVFLDDESYMYEANRNDIDLPLICPPAPSSSLNRFGAPHDLYLLNDLLEGRLPPLQALYLPQHLPPERPAPPGAARTSSGAVAARRPCGMYAPGYINADADQADRPRPT